MQKWQSEDIQVLQADFLQSNLPTDSVDLIVTSPPYNVGIAYATYEDADSYATYLTFSKAWLAEAFRVLKDDGRLCLNIPLDKNKGGSHCVAADLSTIAKEVGFKYHATIVWNEGNISRRTAWGSFRSASAPYVIAPVEVIVVLYKAQWKKRSSGTSDISRDEFIAWTNGLWTFNGESKKRVGHPAPFPIELPKRCIKLFSYVGDTVLDPFLGSGTTLLACHQQRRVGIGVEIDAGYYTLAVQRIQNECRIDQLQLYEGNEASPNIAGDKASAKRDLMAERFAS